MATAPISLAPTTGTLASWHHLEHELTTAHIEREAVIHTLLLGLLARQHTIILGPPGTGKSRLARDLCQRITGRFFEWQLTRLSTPEELFGPMSLQGLQHDEYRRIPTGKLPEADIAYLDETFKASSAILNTLLGVMNERVFYNNGQPQAIPLQMLVGASNELPDDREELGALWDRFLIRHVVDYVQDPQAFTAVLASATTPPVTTTLTSADLAHAQAAVAAVDAQPIFPHLVHARQALAESGIIVSDRRWRQSLTLLQAEAWWQGRTQVDLADCLVLKHVLWQEPDQRSTVAKTLLAMISPFDQAAQDVLDDAKDTYLQTLAADTADAEHPPTTEFYLERVDSLKAAGRQLKQICAKAQEDGHPSPVATQALDQVVQWIKILYDKSVAI
jgi:MoxR-like ATPase